MAEDKFTPHIVVCTEFHQALGVMANISSAAALAKQLNDTSECTYLPMPLTFLERGDLEAMGIDAKWIGGEEEERELPRGQYL